MVVVGCRKCEHVAYVMDEMKNVRFQMSSQWREMHKRIFGMRRVSQVRPCARRRDENGQTVVEGCTCTGKLSSFDRNGKIPGDLT